MTLPEPDPRAELPRPLAGAVTFVAIPLGGVLAGAVLAVATAPGSGAAFTIGAIALPLGYLLAIAAWRALLGVWLTAVIGRSMLRSGGSEERFRAETIRSFGAIRQAGLGRLPFTWVFVPVGLAVGFAAGLLLLVLTAGSAALAASTLLVAATVQGVLLRRLARAGRLPLPDE